MSRTGCILVALVIPVVAILTVRGEARPTGREGKPQGENVEKMLNDSGCSSCHSVDRKIVGPSYSEIAGRYAAQASAAETLERLARSIREGGSGSWGNLRMTPHPDLKDAQLAEIVRWILSLKDVAPGLSQEAKPKEYTYTVNGKTVTVDFPVFVEGNDKWVTKDIFRGYQLYNSYCYRCHGTDATESELAPDLRRYFGAGKTLQEFLSVVMAGREAEGMPGWAGFFSEEEVQQIYKYVKGRSLELIPGGRPLSEYDSGKN